MSTCDVLALAQGHIRNSVAKLRYEEAKRLQEAGFDSESRLWARWSMEVSVGKDHLDYKISA